jgi:hypothetical protein
MIVVAQRPTRRATDRRAPSMVRITPVPSTRFADHVDARRRVLSTLRRARFNKLPGHPTCPF